MLPEEEAQSREVLQHAQAHVGCQTGQGEHLPPKLLGRLGHLARFSLSGNAWEHRINYETKNTFHPQETNKITHDKWGSWVFTLLQVI